MWLEEVDHSRRYIPTTEFFYPPIIRIRAIARSRNISHTSVHKILRSENMRPYNVQKVQKLLPSDYAQLVESCENMMRMCEEDQTFFDSILWTDGSN
ncbi:unnamed protein product [Acanthoscelides obtectus]|uniref:Uncharacterized protein n=1 Tax=Acanthoscelides obtectus TaxID=200917 RepID=A0A9P0MB19_ACAOB|nr:unnamed protein product [Acanthoscelides obtectus]CAK1642744.1 hypothetical protein AOBTE_LOCUS13193 [Acanthoscelides obtectus]